MDTAQSADLEDLRNFLTIPSVSADPTKRSDMLAASEWVAEYLRNACGGTADVHCDRPQPLVTGHVAASSSTDVNVLIYGHYDVQPPGDLSLWHTAPFAPVVRDGYIYARGASDDKGNFFILLRAVAALVKADKLPVNVYVLCDGEEEIGGDSATSWLASCETSLDACVIFDGLRIESDTPVLCTGTRGLLYLRIEVVTATQEVHSGTFGGIALNAAHVLIQMLARVIDTGDGLPPELLFGAATNDVDDAWLGLKPSLLSELKLLRRASEEEFAHRTWMAPSLDVHGLQCGDPGVVKTSIPASASATVSMRVAPGQSNEICERNLSELLVAAAPQGAQVELATLSDVRPSAIGGTSSAIGAACAAFEGVLGVTPMLVREGGTLPLMAELADRGIPVVMTTFSEPDDNVHAPNERFRIGHIHQGAEVATELLQRLGATS